MVPDISGKGLYAEVCSVDEMNLAKETVLSGLFLMAL